VELVCDDVELGLLWVVDVLPKVESLLEGDALELLLEAGVEDDDWVQEELLLVLALALAGVVDEED